MLKLLIAIRSRALSDALVQHLSSQFEVHCCSTGADAAQVLEDLRPDALVIDLRLPGIGGLTVLEGCNYRPSAIIAITDYIDEDVIRRVEATGVKVLVRIPCTARCITEYLERITEEASPDR